MPAAKRVQKLAGTDYMYTATLKLEPEMGARATGEILINRHSGFQIRRVTWDHTGTKAPRVRIGWRDSRRNYMDRPALISAAFGKPGEDFDLAHPVLITGGETITIEATNAQSEGSEIDVVFHGIELRDET